MIRPLAVNLLSLDLIISRRPFIRGCNLSLILSVWKLTSSRIFDSWPDILWTSSSPWEFTTTNVTYISFPSCFQLFAVMDNTSNILILGHSFVRRLQTFLTEHHDRRAAHNMNLPHENVSFLGIGGRTASKMLSFDLDKIKLFSQRLSF